MDQKFYQYHQNSLPQGYFWSQYPDLSPCQIRQHYIYIASKLQNSNIMGSTRPLSLDILKMLLWERKMFLWNTAYANIIKKATTGKPVRHLILIMSFNMNHYKHSLSFLSFSFCSQPIKLLRYLFSNCMTTGLMAKKFYNFICSFTNLCFIKVNGEFEFSIRNKDTPTSIFCLKTFWHLKLLLILIFQSHIKCRCPVNRQVTCVWNLSARAYDIQPNYQKSFFLNFNSEISILILRSIMEKSHNKLTYVINYSLLDFFFI